MSDVIQWVRMAARYPAIPPLEQLRFTLSISEAIRVREGEQHPCLLFARCQREAAHCFVLLAGGAQYWLDLCPAHHHRLVLEAAFAPIDRLDWSHCFAKDSAMPWNTTLAAGDEHQEAAMSGLPGTLPPFLRMCAGEG